MVSARMSCLVASMSSAGVTDGFDNVDGRVTVENLYFCSLKSEVTLSQMLALCQAPGTSTKVGRLAILGTRESPDADVLMC
jgi:hypothetical protein